MAAFLRLLLIFWVALRYGQSQSPSTGMMTINPPAITLTLDTIAMGTKMSMTCRPRSGAAVANLQSMSIMKDKVGSDPWNGDVLVRAALSSGSTNNEAKLESNLRNVTVSGSIEQKTISLTLNQASCSDGGTYVCATMYFDSSNTFHWQYHEVEVKVEVDAEQLSMAVSPERPLYTEVWKAGDKLSMRCLGPVGSVNTTGENPQPQITWVWQYRNLGRDWTTYTNDMDITVGNFIGMSNNCYKNQSSTLLRNLTTGDSGREYRCFVRRDFQDKKEFAASYFIGTVTADGTVPDVEEPSDPSKANVGAIVGGIFGALILIAVVIIIVYFVVIRPRRRKQQDDEKVDGPTDKGDDADALPPYPNDPSVLYSQPKRRGKDKTEGVTNKAMDDPEDKQTPIDTKLPADNDDRRHGRRHKDKKVSSAPPEADPAYDPAANDDYDPRYDRPDHGHRDQRHRRQGDNGENPDSRERSRHHDNDRHGDDEHRRGRRRRDADDYDKPARYDDDYGRGRRNRGYEQDSRNRGHHSSSEDGGMDSYVNTSQYSMGDGDPTIGTAI